MHKRQADDRQDDEELDAPLKKPRLVSDVEDLILSYLPDSEKLRARQVCSRWRRAIDSSLLTSLFLDADPSDQLAERFYGSTGVTFLGVLSCDATSSAVHLAERFPQLQELDISYVASVTPDTLPLDDHPPLDALSNLRLLRGIEVRKVEKLLPSLTRLHRLSSLSLWGPRDLPSADALLLGRLSNLESLDLDSNVHPQDIFSLLSSLPRLRSLVINSRGNLIPGVAVVALSTTLERLSISFEYADHWSWASSFPCKIPDGSRLRSLEMDKLSVPMLASLRYATGLESLVLRDEYVGAVDDVEAGLLRVLTEGIRQTATCIRNLVLPGLSSWTADAAYECHDRWMELCSLPSLANLEHLEVGRWEYGEGGEKAITLLPRLRSFHQRRFSDQEVWDIGGFSDEMLLFFHRLDHFFVPIGPRSVIRRITPQQVEITRFTLEDYMWDRKLCTRPAFALENYLTESDTSYDDEGYDEEDDSSYCPQDLPENGEEEPASEEPNDLGASPTGC